MPCLPCSSSKLRTKNDAAVAFFIIIITFLGNNANIILTFLVPGALRVVIALLLQATDLIVIGVAVMI